MGPNLGLAGESFLPTHAPKSIVVTLLSQLFDAVKKQK